MLAEIFMVRLEAATRDTRDLKEAKALLEELGAG